MRSGSVASSARDPYTPLADGDRTDTGHHLAVPQVTVAPVALVGRPQSSNRHGLPRKSRPRPRPLAQQSPRPIAQDFGELMSTFSAESA